MMSKCKAWREGRFLFIKRYNKKGIVRYDFKNKVMEKDHKEKGQWKVMKQQYHFFSGMDVEDIDFGDDEKSYKLLKFIRNKMSHINSISSFLTKLEEVEIYEGYINEGIKIDVRYENNYYGTRSTIPIYNLYENYSKLPLTWCGLRSPITVFDKNTISFFKENDILVGSMHVNFLSKEGTFKNKKIISALSMVEADASEKRDFLRWAIAHNHSYNYLVENHKCEEYSLINYCINYLKPFENVDYPTSLITLSDYYRMSNTIGRKIKKYPKYLLSLHSIIVANYNAYKKEYDEIAFQNIIKEYKSLEYEKGGFAIVVPEKTDDIVVEGVDLNHCVSSYVDRIISGKTMIIFLRYSKEKDSSLLTVEIKNNNIIQARGSYNRSANEEEIEFLKKFCKNKKIELSLKF